MNIDIKGLYAEVVDYFGGQHKTAIMLELKQPSISAWFTRGVEMSPQTALLAQKHSNGKFLAKDLCPQLSRIEGLVIEFKPGPQTKTPAAT